MILHRGNNAYIFVRFFKLTRIVTRKAAEARTYKGIKIPKDMCIQANVWALHRDEEYWADPENFNPERYEYHVYFTNF